MVPIRKKTWLIDQSLVDRVRRIYRVKTETAAVTKALEEAVIREELDKVFRACAGKIPRIKKVF